MRGGFAVATVCVLGVAVLAACGSAGTTPPGAAGGGA